MRQWSTGTARVPSSIRLAATVAAFAYVGLSARDARAETLYDAFRAAFNGNEVLASQRAAVRVGQQDRAIAATGYAPSVAATSDYGYEDLKGHAPGTKRSESTTHPRGYGVSLSQNLFNSFGTSNSVLREDARLQSERDRLLDVEQKVLLDVVTFYADVVRDKAVLELRRRDRVLLETRAKQTRYRFQIGELTRTDVDQSEASLAKSQASLTIAQNNLQASAAAFQSVVGHDPDRLEPAGVPDRLLPRDTGSAVAIAQTDHPAIRAAIAAVQAAEANIDVERAAFGPSLDLTASAEHRWDPDFYPSKTDLTSGTVVGRLSIPIYDRGLTFASVHRANELASQEKLRLDHQRVETRASVVQSRGTFEASRSVIASADLQIAASERALTGVELEATAGQRTTLDVLISQQSLLDARVDREIAQHDRVIAGYRYLAAIGHLSVSRLTPADTRGRDLGLGTPRTLPPLERFPTAAPGSLPSPEDEAKARSLPGELALASALAGARPPAGRPQDRLNVATQRSESPRQADDRPMIGPTRAPPHQTQAAAPAPMTNRPPAGRPQDLLAVAVQPSGLLGKLDNRAATDPTRAPRQGTPAATPLPPGPPPPVERPDDLLNRANAQNAVPHKVGDQPPMGANRSIQPATPPATPPARVILQPTTAALTPARPPAGRPQDRLASASTERVPMQADFLFGPRRGADIGSLAGPSGLRPSF